MILNTVPEVLVDDGGMPVGKGQFLVTDQSEINRVGEQVIDLAAAERILTDLGHQVRLIAPQFVTPYVKSNKNDRNDAEAIGPRSEAGYASAIVKLNPPQTKALQKCGVHIHPHMTAPIHGF